VVRHLLGLLAGVAVTPLLWVGVAWAGDQIARHAAGQESSVPLPTACAVLMGVGLLGAVLAATRFSPLAAFVSGGVLLGGPLWALLDPGSLTQLLPAWLVGSDSLVHPLGPGCRSCARSARCCSSPRSCRPDGVREASPGPRRCTRRFRPRPGNAAPRRPRRLPQTPPPASDQARRPGYSDDSPVPPRRGRHPSAGGG